MTSYVMRISDWSSDLCSSDPAGNDIPIGTRLAVWTKEAFGLRRRRRRLAAVDRRDAVLRVVMKHEAAAADAAQLRFDERQHRDHRHGGVGRGAALMQNLAPRQIGRAHV